jgi:ATP-dependent DNA ligase
VVRSRSGANLAARFPEVLSAVLALTRGRGGGVVHDGEVVALREGRLDFPALSYGPARRAREGVEVRYVAFDVLAADGADLRDRPYTVRRAQLVELLDRAAGAEPSVVDLVPASDHREAALSWMAPHWSALGIEGIVAKRLDSPYVAGRRAGSPWVKVRQRVVGGVLVLGVTGPPSGPTALVLGPSPPPAPGT